MSNFKEAGRDIADNQSPLQGSGLPVGMGLPMLWSNLSNDLCPRCSEPLRAFEHLNLYKCVCGFKISSYKLEHIKLSLEQKEDQANGQNGWNYGDYLDENPF